MAETNWTLSPLSDGTNMWDKYKNSTEYLYHMSQTDITLNTLNAKIQLLHTTIEPDEIQPPKEELIAIQEKNLNSVAAPKSFLLAPKTRMPTKDKKKKKKRKENQ